MFPRLLTGFQHDLYLLDSHFTATSVRVTFTGTDVKITEIMLLEFGLEIDSNADFTEIATNFVDRTGVVHPDPSGGLSAIRLRSEGDAIDGRSTTRLRLSLGKRFWKRRRIFCTGGQRTETTFFAWSHRDSPGGFSQRCLLGRVFR